MRQKLAFFDRRRDSPSSPTPMRLPWRARKRETVEPRRASASQSEFNSIQINTADYPPDLLRKYDDDERINISSISHPKSERDQQSHSPKTNELEQVQSEGRKSRPKQNAPRRQGECLFVTSGYRVHANSPPNLKEILSGTEGLTTDGQSSGFFPFPEQSREDFFLRGKGCLLILFVLLALATVSGLSWYYSCHGPLKRGTVHALVTANPVAKLLGIASVVDKTSDARQMWINHVVKNDDDQILIAETFESRLNAEISPLLDKYVDKIWGDPSSTSVTCHGGDRLMVAFSMAKAGLMPASITYETPCMNGPSSRSCVVKKQIADVRDLVVRLPSKSSRYMYAVHLEVDHSSKEDSKNSSEVRHIQDLGMVSGQFRVELSDASRLALQRYCGQNPLAYSEDLLTEPVSERNTRLINVYELKRLYGLLSSRSDTPISGSSAWDILMLSTVVIDPLEHSRHSLAPIHVQQLLSHLPPSDSHTLHGTVSLQSPRIAVSIPQKNNLFRHSAAPSQEVSERNTDASASISSPSSHLASPSSSNPSSSPTFSSSSPAETDTKEPAQSYTVQHPGSQSSVVKEPSKKKSPLHSHNDPQSASLRTTTEPVAPPAPTDGAIVDITRNETTERIVTTDDGVRSASDLESSVAHDGTTLDGTTAGRKTKTVPSQDEQQSYHGATKNVLASSQTHTPPAPSERSTVFSSGDKESAPLERKDLTARKSTPEPTSLSKPATTQISNIPKHDKPSPSAPPQQALSPSSTSVVGRKAPFVPNLIRPTSFLSSRRGEGPQGTEEKFPTLLVKGARIGREGHAKARQAATQSRTNAAQGSAKPNSVIQSSSTRTKHSRTEAPSRPVRNGLFQNSGASSRIKRTLSSTRKQLSSAQELSASVDGAPATRLRVISPPHRKASAMHTRLPSPAHGSSLVAQKRPFLLRGALTSTGALLSSTNGGIRLKKGGNPATQDAKSNRRPLPRGPQSQPVYPRRVVRTQMIMYGQRQSDISVPAPRGFSGRQPAPTGVLAIPNSQSDSELRYQNEKEGSPSDEPTNIRLEVRKTQPDIS